MGFKPKCLATSIGSLPHKEPRRAVELVLESLPRIPAWPQLPRRRFEENMCAQFSEGMPCLIVDSRKQKVHFDTSGDRISELERFYDRSAAEDLDYFAISERYASGFHAFLEYLQERSYPNLLYLKGQVTGLVTFGLTVLDKNGRASLYDDNLSDLILKALCMKAKWQIKRLKEIGKNVIIFIDEPGLSTIGSAFFNLNRAKIVQQLNTLVEAIHSRNGTAGIHCCGNTDWPMLLATDIDILSFDAYNFADSIILYPEEIKEFLARDGTLAWGIVPASEAAFQETAQNLVSRLESGMGILVERGLDKGGLLESCLVTPSCGTGLLSVQLAERVLALTHEVSDILKSKYFKI